MTRREQCNRIDSHPEHEWSKMVQAPGLRSRATGEDTFRAYHWCDGVGSAAGSSLLPDESVTLGGVSYHNLTRLRLEFVSREGVPTELDFTDLVAGDSRVNLSVIAHDDRGWAYVEVKMLTRKPYIAREVDHEQ